MQEDQPLLLLVDGSSYLYRAFHAMPDLRARPSDPSSPATGAIRGMINMMQSLQKDFPTHFAACVFDAKGPTFRDEWYPAYKAQRSAMPDDLRSQIEPIHEVVQLLGWPVLTVPGVEADDVLGTLAKLASAQGFRVVISSGDKDMSQLVDERIMIFDTMNQKKRDVQGVEKEFGVPPERMIDYQTLVGDSVDNVPGVPKVGPKTAVKWLTQYGSLDAVIANAAEITGVVGENLRNSLEWLPMAKRLVTIKTDCDLSMHLPQLPEMHDLKLSKPRSEGLVEFCEKFGFKGLVKAFGASLHASEQAAPSSDLLGAGVGQEDTREGQDLFGDLAPKPSLILDRHYECITTWEQFERSFEALKRASLVSLDTETDSLIPLKAQLIGLSWSATPGSASYIPLGHDLEIGQSQLNMHEVLLRLKPWLEDPLAHKLGQHFKYDRHVFANHGIEVQGYVHDTMLESYVLEVHRPHGLESLGQRHLARTGLSYEDVCGKGVHQIPFARVSIDKATQYACEDADMTLEVHEVLWPRIQDDDKLSLIYRLEIDSSEALYRVERNGVMIDAQTLELQSAQLGVRIDQLELEAHALAGTSFNLNSPKQIGEIFFEKLGLPIVKKTAKGAPSTDEEVLEKLALDFPLPAKILEHRGLSKLKSTYTDKLATLINPNTKRVHTHYAQAVAVTGRLSSNDPNLQNIPIRTPEGRRVREAFVAPAECVIASADYSQIELRIMAHISEDEALLKAFHEGIDVHRATAAEIFGVPQQEVSSEQRRYAKVINFGLIYGMSAFGLAKALGIDNTAAKLYIERYFDRFSGVKRYMDSTRISAKAKGYVQTVFGRRLYLPEINSPNGPRRSGSERAAINAPMQGTAADLIKMSMIKIQHEIDAKELKTKIIMQVHDELVFEVPQTELDWVKENVPRLMAQVAALSVPLVAELGFGLNWDQAH
ncbi:MAG: DNA polymerase I [Burkholderiaceae bacterium]